MRATAALDAGGAEGPAAAEATTESAGAADGETETAQARPGRIGWAPLLRQVLDLDERHCPNGGGGELEIIAAILERPVIARP
jgi:hypothetical protein